MTATLGIRREDKNAFEARAPLTPAAVARLVAGGLTVIVQPSSIRAFPDEAYRAAGATLSEDLGACELVVAVKEIPTALLREGGAYLFFSHTIKGQPQNMPLLRRMMELGCTLIDYERITDEDGRRLVFFGRHAGLAGMTDTLSVLGARLAALGYVTPFAELGLAHSYPDLPAIVAAVRSVGDALGELPLGLAPLLFGFAGYGNVSRGAQEIFDLLPHEAIDPSELAGLVGAARPPRDRLFKVVFEERHLVAPNDADQPFVLTQYYEQPELFHSVFEDHAKHLSVLINAIFWTDAYPRLVTRAALRRWHDAGEGRLLLIGDISCDIEGAIECTVKATTPDAPAYVYEPATGSVVDGVVGPGVAMMTTDILPCELPRESTDSFTAALLPFVAATAQADFRGELASAGLPEPIRRAVILWRGELTEAYAYLHAHVRP